MSGPWLRLLRACAGRVATCTNNIVFQCLLGFWGVILSLLSAALYQYLLCCPFSLRGKWQQLIHVVSVSFAFLRKKHAHYCEYWSLKLCTIVPHPPPCPITARRLSLYVLPPFACTVAPPVAEEYWRACSCDTTHIQRCKSSAHAHCVATSKCRSFACSVFTLFYAHDS